MPCKDYKLIKQQAIKSPHNAGALSFIIFII